MKGNYNATANKDIRNNCVLLTLWQPHMGVMNRDACTFGYIVYNVNCGATKCE